MFLINSFIKKDVVLQIQREYQEIKNQLSSSTFVNGEYGQDMLMVAEGICVVAELFAKLSHIEIDKLTNTKRWLEKYSNQWLSKNKPSELIHLQEMFLYCEAL